MASVESYKRAYEKYTDTHDRVNCRLDPGTKDRIKKLGYTTTGFIKLAVAEKLEREREGKHGTQDK